MYIGSLEIFINESNLLRSMERIEHEHITSLEASLFMAM
jgi:hypothetical protein